MSRWLLFVVLAGISATLSAGEVRMRSGVVISGSPRKLQSLTGRTDPNAQVTSYPVLMMQTGSTRYFLASKQIAEDGLNLDNSLSKVETFRLKQHKSNAKSMFASIGQFAEVTPFDSEGNGHRMVRLNTSPTKSIEVYQGITEISPETVKLMGLNYNWDYGIATKSIPPEMLEKILRHRIDPKDSQKRLQLTRFYIQAEMFPQAFRELDAIARDFPDLKDRVTSVHEGLLQEFGRVVLKELKLRVEAGQHRLAEEYVRQLPANIGGAVQRETQEFIKQSERQRETMIHARELLDELAAKLPESVDQEKLRPLRSIILEELHPDSLPRLDPFLKAEADNGYSVSEKLALAYSGWVLGAANAVTDLDQAVRIWDARFQVLEALRTDSLNERQMIYEQLRKIESIGPEVVRKMIPQLPPAVETPDIQPGQAHRIDVERDDPEQAFSYSVLLPLEYSPQHSYPVVITLRAEGRKLEEMLNWWGGTAEQPGLAQRRGYIVIAPEYASADQGKYPYDSGTHFRVLAALNDARRRFNIDSDRVFLSGHGMGADAAFDLGFSHPDVFAGVMPVCGVLDLYPKHYIENGEGTNWYVVGGERDRDTSSKNAGIFNGIMKNHGFKIDFLFAEFMERGYENYAEESPRLFDWMAVHRRMPLPKDFHMKTLRQTDGRFFWVSANDLPKSTLLNLPNGQKPHVKASQVTARIAPGSGSGNRIELDSLSSRYTVWIHPDLVDLEKRVIVIIKHQQRHNDFVDADLAATLEDFHERGDRQRLYVARLEF